MVTKYKEVSTLVLIRILESLPETSTVYVNTVGNLIVNDADYEMIGYIDISEARFVPVEED